MSAELMHLEKGPDRIPSDHFRVSHESWLEFPHLRLDRAHSFPQTRGEVDPDVRDLVPALLSYSEDGSDGRVELLTPPTIGVFTLGAIENYLKQLSNFWETEVPTLPKPSITPNGERYIVTVAGHRRFKAIGIAADELKGEVVPRNQIWVPVSPTDDPDFMSGLQQQYRENVHRVVPLPQDAHVIDKTYKWLQSMDPNVTFTALANYLGITPEKASNGIRFSSLPEDTKDSVRRGAVRVSDSLFLEEIGSALAYRLLKAREYPGCEQMVNKLLSNQLRLAEVLPMLKELGLYMDWLETFNAERTRVSNLAADRVGVYATQLRQAQVNSQTLFGGIYSESQTPPTEGESVVDGYIQGRRSEVSRMVLTSLRAFLAALQEDLSKLEQAHDAGITLRPVIGSSRHAQNTWGVIAAKIGLIIGNNKITDTCDVDYLRALTESLEVLVEDLQTELILSSRRDEVVQIFNDFVAKLRGIPATGSVLAIISNLISTTSTRINADKS